MIIYILIGIIVAIISVVIITYIDKKDNKPPVGSHEDAFAAGFITLAIAVFWPIALVTMVAWSIGKLIDKLYKAL